MFATNGRSKFQCSVGGCGIPFRDRTDYTKHVRTTHPVRHRCDFCRIEFDNEREKDKHAIEKHEMRYKCKETDVINGIVQKCERLFDLPNFRNTHIRQVHKKGGKTVDMSKYEEEDKIPHYLTSFRHLNITKMSGWPVLGRKLTTFFETTDGYMHCKAIKSKNVRRGKYTSARGENFRCWPCYGHPNCEAYILTIQERDNGRLIGLESIERVMECPWHNHLPSCKDLAILDPDNLPVWEGEFGQFKYHDNFFKFQQFLMFELGEGQNNNVEVYICTEFGCSGTLYYIRSDTPNAFDGLYYDRWLLPSTNLMHPHETFKFHELVGRTSEKIPIPATVGGAIGGLQNDEDDDCMDWDSEPEEKPASENASSLEAIPTPTMSDWIEARYTAEEDARLIRAKPYKQPGQKMALHLLRNHLRILQLQGIPLPWHYYVESVKPAGLCADDIDNPDNIFSPVEGAEKNLVYYHDEDFIMYNDSSEARSYNSAGKIICKNFPNCDAYAVRQRPYCKIHAENYNYMVAVMRDVGNTQQYVYVPIIVGGLFEGTVNDDHPGFPQMNTFIKTATQHHASREYLKGRKVKWEPVGAVIFKGPARREMASQLYSSLSVMMIFIEFLDKLFQVNKIKILTTFTKLGFNPDMTKEMVNHNGGQVQFPNNGEFLEIVQTMIARGKKGESGGVSEAHAAAMLNDFDKELKLAKEGKNRKGEKVFKLKSEMKKGDYAVYVQELEGSSYVGGTSASSGKCIPRYHSTPGDRTYSGIFRRECGMEMFGRNLVGCTENEKELLDTDEMSCMASFIIANMTKSINSTQFYESKLVKTVNMNFYHRTVLVPENIDTIRVCSMLVFGRRPVFSYTQVQSGLRLPNAMVNFGTIITSESDLTCFDKSMLQNIDDDDESIL